MASQSIVLLALLPLFGRYGFPSNNSVGPGDGSGSATARTAAGAIAAVDEASASGGAARRAIDHGTALGSWLQQQPPLPQQPQPPRDGATAGVMAAGAGPGLELMDPGPLAARIARGGP